MLARLHEKYPAVQYVKRPATRTALAKELHPQLDLRLVPRCAHLLQWDAADAFAELAGGFLSSGTDSAAAPSPR